MQPDKAIRIALTAAITMLASICASQIFTRDFRQSEESPYHHGTSYRAVEVAEHDEYYNVYWKKWLIDDIKTFEEDNMLDMKTQEGLNNDGYFVSPRDVVFTIMRDFARRIREENGGGGAWSQERVSGTTGILGH